MIHAHKISNIKALFAFAIFLGLAQLGLVSCGGGGSDSPSPSASTTLTLSGMAAKGPVSGGTVTAYAVTASGGVGDALGTTMTDADGNYTLSINYTSPVLLEITGGTYTDEVTGTSVAVPTAAGSGLQAVVSNVTAGSNVQVQITPLTSMAAARAQAAIGGLTAANIDAANQQVSAHFGLPDILSTQPINPIAPDSANGATQDAINYGLILAGFSEEAMTLGLTNPFELVTDLVQDFSDGSFDGIAGSTPIQLNGSTMNPAAGTVDLATAIDSYSGDTSHNLSGGTVSSSLVTTITNPRTRFTIAATAENNLGTTGREQSASVAFDGTNYLVGIQGDSNSDQNVTAQLVDGSGNLVGSRIAVTDNTSTGRNRGGAPFVAFDGADYLMIWEEDSSPSTKLYGVLIDKSGTQLGSIFTVATGSAISIGDVIFDGSNYFVAWGNQSNSGQGYTSDVFGQFVTTSGQPLGSPLTISNAQYGQRFPGVAFDGTNILVAWVDGRRQVQTGIDPCSGNPAYFETDVYGQFVTKSAANAAGTLLGSNFAINENSDPSDNPIGVAFDGTNYLVVWSDETTLGTACVNGEIDGGQWHLYGQFLDKAGAGVGGVIAVSTAAGSQELPRVAFGGTQYLVTWTDMRNDANHDGVCDSNEGSCWDVYGRYVDTSGSLQGGEFAIDNADGNQFGFSTSFNNGGFLIITNTVDLTDGSKGDVYGTFMKP